MVVDWEVEIVEGNISWMAAGKLARTDARRWKEGVDRKVVGKKEVCRKDLGNSQS